MLHKLEDLLFISVVATIANAGCWEEIADFGAGHVEWFRRFIDLPNGAPSHDTFERAFKWIDVKEFERMFILWMKEICHNGEFRVIALDGKTMRGSGDKQTGRKPLNIVSAYHTSEGYSKTTLLAVGILALSYPLPWLLFTELSEGPGEGLNFHRYSRPKLPQKNIERNVSM